VEKPWTIDQLGELYFCTDTVVGWHAVLTSPVYFGAIIESLKYCRMKKGLRLHGYVIMPNHMHTIVSAANGSLSGIIRDYKRFTSQRISSLLEADGNQRFLRYFRTVARREGRGNTYKIWQGGSHPELIVSQGFFLQKLNYVHENPVRKGYVDRPEHWVYSSARNYYLNDHSVIHVDILE